MVNLFPLKLVKKKKYTVNFLLRLTIKIWQFSYLMSDLLFAILRLTLNLIETLCDQKGFRDH